MLTIDSVQGNTKYTIWVLPQLLGYFLFYFESFGKGLELCTTYRVLPTIQSFIYATSSYS